MFFKQVPETKSKASMAKNRRVHLANERTFLAWIRTAIGIMAFGFVIEKFGVAPLSKSTSAFQCNCVAYAGLFLVLLGALVALLATYRFLKLQKDIMEDVFRPSFAPDVMIAILLGSIGLLLVVYLVAVG
jgi:putative membrane protein